MELRFNREKKTTLRGFWEKYLLLYNLESNKLTNMEISILSYVFSKPTVSWFRGRYSKQIAEDLNISKSRISALKKNLIEKGWLQELGRGDIMLSNKWINVARATNDKVKKDKIIRLKFEFEEILL